MDYLFDNREALICMISLHLSPLPNDAAPWKEFTRWLIFKLYIFYFIISCIGLFFLIFLFILRLILGFILWFFFLFLLLLLFWFTLNFLFTLCNIRLINFSFNTWTFRFSIWNINQSVFIILNFIYNVKSSSLKLNKLTFRKIIKIFKYLFEGS